MSPLLIILFILVCGLDLLIVMMPRILRSRGVLLVWKTMFGPALVFDSEADGETVRLLNVRGTFQSIAYVDPSRRDELVCLYHQYFAQALEPVDLHRALVLGCGGYSFPRWLLAARSECAVDAVEIDPAITKLARKWFWLSDVEAEHGAMGVEAVTSSHLPGAAATWKERLSGDGRLREVEGDAWAYLQGAVDEHGLPVRWSLIVNDAFSGKHPLGAMETGEGACVVHEHLVAGGVYCANVISALQGRKAAPLHEVEEAFGRQFRWLYLFPERPEAPDKRGNNAFVASDRDLHIRDEFVLKGPKTS